VSSDFRRKRGQNCDPGFAGGIQLRMIFMCSTRQYVRPYAAQAKAVEKQVKPAKCAFFASQWFAAGRGLV
jgi:hypothetical protein